MPALDDVIRERLQLLEAKGQKRAPVTTRRGPGGGAARGGRELISFSDNDYFGLSQHPRVIGAARAALEEHGAGAGASRLITGEHPFYSALEAALAAYRGTEGACVFGSGYLANIGTIAALAGKGDLILADRLSHACMLDGARLSGADTLRFAHNNVEHCRALLAQHRGDYQHCLILTETVFSMNGDRAPLAELRELADEFGCWLMVDDAHGLGILPPQRADVIMGTLSKGLGTYGGYVCGSGVLMEYLKSTARSLVFSTALPPAVVAGASEALAVLQGDAGLAVQPLELARYFTQITGLPEAQSAIVPIVLGQEEKALKAATKLEEKGFLVVAIRPPTVPPGTARLRIAFSALHTRAQANALSDTLLGEGILCPASLH